MAPPQIASQPVASLTSNAQKTRSQSVPPTNRDTPLVNYDIEDEMDFAETQPNKRGRDAEAISSSHTKKTKTANDKNNSEKTDERKYEPIPSLGNLPSRTFRPVGNDPTNQRF